MANDGPFIEIWTDIKDYEGHYQVSNYGRVKSLTRRRAGEKKYIIKEKILIPGTHRQGYKTYFLSNGVEKRLLYVHRLVAIAFILNPDPKNKKNINHKWGIKYLNSVNDVEWCTQKENIRHSHRTGLVRPARGKSVNNSVLKEMEVIYIRLIYKTGDCSQEKLGKLFNVSRGCIAKIVTRKTWKHI